MRHTQRRDLVFHPSNSNCNSQEGVPIDQPCFSYFDSPALNKVGASEPTVATAAGNCVANQTIHVMVYRDGLLSGSSLLQGNDDRTACDGLCQVTV